MCGFRSTLIGATKPRQGTAFLVDCLTFKVRTGISTD